MKNNWTDIIYDIYDFLYWEPQHIWKIKNENIKINNLDKSIKHIKNMEVSLNQILNLFFYFLPNKIFYDFIWNILNKNIEGKDHTLYLKDIENLIDWIEWSTQPDFFFIGKNSNIFIEMKINAKSSLEQLMKYIFLHIKDCERENKQKELNLIFLWKNNFSNLWKEKFENIDELKAEFKKYEISDKMKKWDVDLLEYKEKIKEFWIEMNIWFLNYIDFSNFCEKQVKENKNDDKLIWLFEWLIQEFNERKLK